MVQVPVARPVTTPVLPSTEQKEGVTLVYRTGRPELAVAETVTVAWSTAGVGGTAKLIVCGSALTFEPSPPQPPIVKMLTTVSARETVVLPEIISLTCILPLISIQFF
jgi:hypothetical protein